MALHIGAFMDLRNPAPWRVPWVEHYQRSLEQAAEVERLGGDAVWCSEHHGFDDGYLPQPLTFAAALAARTSRIRLGTAIVLGALRHPRHLAEEAALVDVLSGGRVELGLGAGYGIGEYAAFDRDITTRYRDNDAALAEVRRLLDGDSDEAGERKGNPAGHARAGGSGDAGGGLAVTPPPVQHPFPLWLGYQGPQGARRAGRAGAGLLTLNRASLEPYRQGLVEAGHDPGSARMGGVIDVIVADDPDRTLQRLLPHYAHQVNTYAALRAVGHGPAPAPWTAETLGQRIEPGGRVLGLTVCSPSDAVALIAGRIAGLPVAHVYLWASIAGMPADIAERHLELTFGTVAPALRQLAPS